MTDDRTDAECDPDTEEPPVAVTLENRLMGHGIYLTSFTWKDEGGPPTEDGTGIELAYEVVADASGITRNEVGTVLRTLLTIGDERSWTPGRLEVTSLTTDGDIRGWWYVEREWFEQLGSGLSQLEFSQRVLGTIKNYRAENDSR